MAIRIFVPRDATACALGADEVAEFIRKGAEGRGLEVEVVRNGSRGAAWLEPLVEVEVVGPEVRESVALLSKEPHILELDEHPDIAFQSSIQRSPDTHGGEALPCSVNGCPAFESRTDLATESDLVGFLSAQRRWEN